MKSDLTLVDWVRRAPGTTATPGATTVCIDQETRDQTTATSGRPRHRHQSRGPRNGVPPLTVVCCPSEGRRTRVRSRACDDGPGSLLGQRATHESWGNHLPSCSAPNPRPGAAIINCAGCADGDRPNAALLLVITRFPFIRDHRGDYLCVPSLTQGGQPPPVGHRTGDLGPVTPATAAPATRTTIATTSAVIAHRHSPVQSHPNPPRASTATAIVSAICRRFSGWVPVTGHLRVVGGSSCPVGAR